MVGSNAFIKGVDETKVVQDVILSQSYKAIVGGLHPNRFISVGVMTKGELQDRIGEMIYYNKHLYLAYEVKITVLSIQRV